MSQDTPGDLNPLWTIGSFPQKIALRQLPVVDPEGDARRTLGDRVDLNPARTPLSGRIMASFRGVEFCDGIGTCIQIYRNVICTSPSMSDEVLTMDGLPSVVWSDPE